MNIPDPSIFTEYIYQYIPEPHASLLSGMLFGVELDRGTNFYDKVLRVGLLHLVVLSGTNITLLISMITHMTKYFGKKFSIVSSFFGVIMFVIFVGPDPPVVRAAIMGGLSLLAVLYERRYVAVYGLFFSAIVIAILNFEWVTSVSFQLSFAASLGIILFGKHAGSFRLRDIIYAELRIALAAYFATTPIIFFYFQQISLIAPVANLLVSFIVAPIMLLGFATVFLGTIHSSLGLIPAYVTYGLLSYLVGVIFLLEKLPFTFFEF